MCYFSLSSVSSPKIENWTCHSVCYFSIFSVSFPQIENWKLVLKMPLHVLSLPLPCVFPLQQNCTTYVDNIFLRIIPPGWGIKVKRLKKRVWQPFFSLLSWKCISLEIWKPFPTNSATSSATWKSSKFGDRYFTKNDHLIQPDSWSSWPKEPQCDIWVFRVWQE